MIRTHILLLFCFFCTFPTFTVDPTWTWKPTKTINGWFPSLSPNGNYVAYGFGESYVANFRTKKEYGLFGPNRTFSNSWIKNETMTYISIGNKKESLGRWEVVIDEWKPKKTNDNPVLTQGNGFTASDGHWASWLATRPARVAYDNQLVGYNLGGEGPSLSVSEDWLVTPYLLSPYEIYLYKKGTLYNKYVPKIPIHEITMRSGYIMYGGYGLIYGIYPNGTQINLSVAPWKWERLCGCRPFYVGNTLWTATTTTNNGHVKNYILLRPWGSQECVVVNFGASGLDVIATDKEFVIAANNNRGGLQVVGVPLNSKTVPCGSIDLL